MRGCGQSYQCHNSSRYFTLTGYTTVRVKGGMSLRNGMWHGLRNEIIMRKVKYGKWRKEIN